MTRRDFIWTAAAAAIPSSAQVRLLMPVHRVTDAPPQCPAEQLHHFWSSIWPEAVRDFSQGGIELQTPGK